MVQLSHPYMTTGKMIALTKWTLVGKVMSLLFDMLSRFVIAFLPRSKYQRCNVQHKNIINIVAYYHELRVQNPKNLVHKAKNVLFFFYLYCGNHFMIDINETLQYQIRSDQSLSRVQLFATP